MPALRSKAPLVLVTSLLVVAAVAVATALYPEQVRELLEGQGEPVEAAVLEEAVPKAAGSIVPNAQNPPF